MPKFDTILLLRDNIDSNKKVSRDAGLLLQVTILRNENCMTQRQRKQMPKGSYAKIWLTGALWSRIQPMIKERGDLSGILIEAIEKQLPAIEKAYQAEKAHKAKTKAVNK